MKLSYTTNTRVSGDGGRRRTNTNIMSFTGALWPSLYIIMPKKGHPYEDEEKEPNRNQQIIISFT